MTRKRQWYIVSCCRQDHTYYDVNVLAESRKALMDIMAEPEFLDPGDFVVKVIHVGDIDDYRSRHGVDGEYDF